MGYHHGSHCSCLSSTTNSFSSEGWPSIHLRNVEALLIQTALAVTALWAHWILSGLLLTNSLGCLLKMCKGAHLHFLLFSLSLHHEAGGIEDLTQCYSLYCILTYIILDTHISSVETPSWGLFQLLLLSPPSRIPDRQAIRQEKNHSLSQWLKLRLLSFWFLSISSF